MVQETYMVEEDPEESPPIVSVETGEDGTTRRTETMVITPQKGSVLTCARKIKKVFLLFSGEESHKDHHHPHSHPLRVRHTLP